MPARDAGSTSRICRGGFHYDAARRLVAMDGLIDRVDYDATGYRTGTDYSNGARVTWQHDRRRGWLTRLDAYQAGWTANQRRHLQPQRQRPGDTANTPMAKAITISPMTMPAACCAPTTGTRSGPSRARSAMIPPAT
ncbi:MAG: hypothetical protein JKP98_14635 [Rhodobacteraceae bacterium]|nr:hypothetical protein [Paracoccaceae bacterium]